MCQGMWCALNLFCTSHLVFGCDDPGTPTNGQRTVSRSSEAYYVTYTCDEGYILQGTHIRHCLSNGQWTGSRPRCHGMSVNHQLWDFSCNTICSNLFSCPNLESLQLSCMTFNTACFLQQTATDNPNDWTESSIYTLLKLCSIAMIYDIIMWQLDVS